VFLQPRTERAHEAAGEIGHVLSVGCANRPQHCDRERSERGVNAGLGMSLQPIGERSREAHAHLQRMVKSRL
jgi:hypothetical protein